MYTLTLTVIMADELTDELECAICLDVLNQPRNLNCGHSFCEKCLVRISSATSIMCPTCRQKIAISSHGIDELGKNYTAISIIEKLCTECRKVRWTCVCDCCGGKLCDVCQSGHQERQDTRHQVDLLKQVVERDEGEFADYRSSRDTMLAVVDWDIDTLVAGLHAQVDSLRTTLKSSVQSAIQPTKDWCRDHDEGITDICSFRENNDEALKKYDRSVAYTELRETCNRKRDQLRERMENRPLLHLYIEENVASFTAALDHVAHIKTGDVDIEHEIKELQKLLVDRDSKGIRQNLEKLPVGLRHHVVNRTSDNHVVNRTSDNHVVNRTSDNHVVNRTSDNHVVNRTSDHITSVLFYAVESHDSALASFLLDECRADPDATAFYDDVKQNKRYLVSSLFYASRFNQLETVKLLVAKHADLDWTVTPLAAASLEGHTEVVEHLVAQGADVNKPDAEGVSPVFHAVFRNDDNICQLLLNGGVDVNATDDDKISLLQHAIDLEHKEVADCLLKHGADTAMKDKAGNSYLHYAVNKPEMCSLLLKYECDVNAKNKDGLVPLHCAVDNDHLETTKVLLEHGADANALYPWHGLTCLSRCATKSAEWCQILVKNGAYIDDEDSNGQTALHHAIAAGKLEIVEYLTQNKANASKEDDCGLDAFGTATKLKKNDILDFLETHVKPSKLAIAHQSMSEKSALPRYIFNT